MPDQKPTTTKERLTRTLPPWVSPAVLIAFACMIGFGIKWVVNSADEERPSDQVVISSPSPKPQPSVTYVAAMRTPQATQATPKPKVTAKPKPKATPKPKPSPAELHIPNIGDTTVLIGTGVVPVAKDKQAMDAMFDAMNSKDEEGFRLLVRQGRLILVRVGTPVRVIDRSGFLYTRARIRILKGPHDSADGLVPVEYLKKIKR